MIKYNDTYSFFESKKVKVFPSAYRGTGSIVVENGTETERTLTFGYNPEARMLSEYSTIHRPITHWKNSYVISYTAPESDKDGNLKVVIDGYYFEITLELGDITDLKNKYFVISKTKIDIGDSLLDQKTPILASILWNVDVSDATDIRITAGTLDKELTDIGVVPPITKDAFIGLRIQATEPNINSNEGYFDNVALKVFAENGSILEVNRLPEISHGIGTHSITEGYLTNASGSDSHAEGYNTSASGDCSHAEGWLTIANGSCSHVEGAGTITEKTSQHIFGEYNIIDNEIDPLNRGNNGYGRYIEIVGNGKNNLSRNNARTLDWVGNEWLAGNLTAAIDINAENNISAQNNISSENYLLSNNATIVNKITTKNIQANNSIKIGTNQNITTITGGNIVSSNTIKANTSIEAPIVDVSNKLNVSGTVNSNLIPENNNSYTLGKNDSGTIIQWSDAYIGITHGNLNGNADSADSADKWSSDINMNIASWDGTNASAIVIVNAETDRTLKLPSIIKVNKLETAGDNPSIIGNLIPNTNDTFVLGNSSNRWKQAYLNSTITIGNTGNATASKKIETTISTTTDNITAGTVKPVMTVKYNNENNTKTYITTPISIIGNLESGDTNYNGSLFFGPGSASAGSVFVGAGESGPNLPSTMNLYNTEDLILSADTNVHLVSSCNDNNGSKWIDYKIDGDGNISYSRHTEGSSTSYNTLISGDGYSNGIMTCNFKGNLDGTAQNARGDHAGRLIASNYAASFNSSRSGSNTVGLMSKSGTELSTSLINDVENSNKSNYIMTYTSNTSTAGTATKVVITESMPTDIADNVLYLIY